MDIKIVPAEEKYIQDCVRVGIRAWESVHKSYQNCIGEELHQMAMGDWREKKAESMQSISPENAVVALADGKVAGYIVYRIKGILGQIRDNAVDPDFWGQEINIGLCNAAMVAMRAAGCQCVSVEIGLDEGQAQARRAYSKLGFELNVPCIMYYQKLDPSMEPYATSSDEVQVIPCEQKHLEDCCRIALTAWTIIHDSYIRCIGKEMHDQIHAGWQEQLVKNLAVAQMAGRGYVAIVDGKVAGFAAYRLDGKMGVVARNAVDPVYRGRGIAKLMYGKLINGMIAEGYQYARVHTGLDEGHTGARRAYGKVGFQRNLPSTVYYREL
jgi:ribosomal protein S18 acetylase RimI-like enzyme